MTQEQEQQEQRPDQDSKAFASTSRDAVQLIHISFAADPSASLGVQLINVDVAEREVESMFLPGFAVVGRLLPGETVASQAGVLPGDCIVAVNGHGFRRFAVEAEEREAAAEGGGNSAPAGREHNLTLDHAVVPAGSAYQPLMEKLKAVKAAGGDPPLVLTLERSGWDARANAWGRFLAARDTAVPAAMRMMQDHEAWRTATFPIALHTPGLQRILRDKAVSEIALVGHDLPPTVYVNYGKLVQLQAAGAITTEDVVAAFVIFTERMLARATDARHPQTCQFIDLSGVSITSGFRVDTLKKIYHTFEPNYPETLYKMVIFPVSTIMVSAPSCRCAARVLKSVSWWDCIFDCLSVLYFFFNSSVSSFRLLNHLFFCFIRGVRRPTVHDGPNAPILCQ